MNELPTHELDRLLFALFDDVISAADHRLLQDALLASQAARDRYLELIALHNLLELVAAAPLVATIPKPLSVRGPENRPLPRRPTLAKARLLPIRRQLVGQARRSIGRVNARVIGRAVRNRPLVATAAVLLVVVIVLSRLFVDPPPAARVAAAPGSVFTITHAADLKKPPKENTLSPGSAVDLTQGTLELTLSSGVRGVFRAPETITLTDERHLTLKRGVSWFLVPPQAVGFEVITPHLKIVDLGTEFGVVSRPDGADEIHVLTGKVEASVRNGATARETLVAGESRVVSPTGGLAKIDPQPELFLTRLPATLPYLHWSFDEADPGRFAADGSHPAAGHAASTLVAPAAATAFASVPGRFGSALSSLGNNGYAETAWPGIAGTAPRTVAYWLKVPPGQKLLNPVVGWGSRKLTRSFFTYLKSGPQGAVAAVSCDSFWLEGSTPLDDGEWHHLAAVYTGRWNPDGDPEIQCYVDGQPDPMTRNALANAPRDPLGRIGVSTLCTGPEAIPLTLFTNMFSDRRMPGPPLDLAIDELFVVEAALSVQQIADLGRFNRLAPAQP